MAVHGVRNTADRAPVTERQRRHANRPLSHTERRVLAAIFAEEHARPGALPELRRVAAETLAGDRARAERILRKLRGRAFLQHCTEGFAFGELSRNGRLEARRLTGESISAEDTPPND